VRVKLFWKLGLTYLVILLATLGSADWYAERILRASYLHATEDRLASLTQLAKSRPPENQDPNTFRDWAHLMGASGARVTVIQADGKVLADTDQDPDIMENHAGRPEVRAAFATGEGRSVRYSVTIKRNLVYEATLYKFPDGQPYILRFAIPVAAVDQAVAAIRSRLLAASLLILAAGVFLSFTFSQGLSSRIERLRLFSQRVSQGDFRPLGGEETEDELTELTQSLNQTAARMDQTIQTLTNERNQSRTILSSMAEGVAVIDAREYLVFCNRAFTDTFSLDPARCQGRPVIESIRNVDLLNIARNALKSSDTLRGDLLLGTAAPRYFGVTAAPVPALAGAVSGAHGAVLVLHDQTELRRLERIRQDFVANVSHEFKTPLTAIQGFAETLLGGALEDQENNRRFLEIIRDHAIRLSRLTEDLLKLARVEAGKLEIEFQPVQLKDLIEACAASITMRSNSKQPSVTIDYSDNLPLVQGDPVMLREVLQNLVDNALKYTPANGEVGMRAVAENGNIVVTVSDTGIGIPVVDQERIFERFYRVDAARTREVGGTGLGLSIAKHIVEAHGGRIWVESMVGRGSKFHFSVPISNLIA